MSYRVQRGMGEYDQVGNWGWEFDPPPYDFLAPRDSAPQRAPMLLNGRIMLPAPVLLTPQGLGDCGCGCAGAGSCGGGHSHGLGLFESGFDYTQWNTQEWVFVGVGAYLSMSLLGDLFTVGRGVKKGGQKVARGYRRVKGVVSRKPAYEPS